MSKNFKTSSGGQAVLEGVMMRGVRKSAMAVRKPDKTIHLEEWDNKTPSKISKVPFIRGIFTFIASLVDGYKCLMKSAEISTEGIEDEEPQSKFEKWLRYRHRAFYVPAGLAGGTDAGFRPPVGAFPH